MQDSPPHCEVFSSLVTPARLVMSLKLCDNQNQFCTFPSVPRGSSIHLCYIEYHFQGGLCFHSGGKPRKGWWPLPGEGAGVGRSVLRKVAVRKAQAQAWMGGVQQHGTFQTSKLSGVLRERLQVWGACWWAERNLDPVVESFIYIASKLRADVGRRLRGKVMWAWTDSSEED